LLSPSGAQLAGRPCAVAPPCRRSTAATEPTARAGPDPWTSRIHLSARAYPPIQTAFHCARPPHGGHHSVHPQPVARPSPHGYNPGRWYWGCSRRLAGCEPSIRASVEPSDSWTPIWAAPAPAAARHTRRTGIARRLRTVGLSLAALVGGDSRIYWGRRWGCV